MEHQIKTCNLVLYTKYSTRQLNRYLFISSALIALALIQSLASSTPLALTVITNIILFLICIFWIYICNKTILKHGLLQFDVLYKMVNVLVAMLARSIMEDFYYKYHYFDSLNECGSFCYIDAIIWISTQTLFILCISLLNDGVCINITPKIIIQFMGIIYYCYLFILVFTLKSDKKLVFYSNTKHVDNNNSTTEYTIDWRSIAMSSLFTVIIFLLKQFVYTVRYAPLNKLSVVTFYLPVIIIPMELVPQQM